LSQPNVLCHGDVLPMCPELHDRAGRMRPQGLRARQIRGQARKPASEHIAGAGENAAAAAI
jgi:hypothetical protein